jgi:conjugal transfer pilus assembly protein TraU
VGIRELVITLVLGWASCAWAAGDCHGKFPNPITDICWSCAFPLKIGNGNIMTFGQEDNGASNGTVLCGCQQGAGYRVGVSASIWEPARISEVVRKPYCFPSLSGTEIDFGIAAPGHAQQDTRDGRAGYSFYHVHWYMNPLMYWLEVLLDNFCMEQGSFDLAYLTEVDPFWADSETTFILNPDVVLFSNPVSQAVCAADCVAATSGFPRNELYWCHGCQGTIYPLTGWVAAKTGGVMASTLITGRFINKLHREGLMWAGSGEGGLCGFYPQPIMDKTNYKTSMIYPSAQPKINGKCCSPIGRTTVLSGASKEFPYKGEDFTYQIFRKRTCCQGANVFQ